MIHNGQRGFRATIGEYSAALYPQILGANGQSLEAHRWLSMFVSMPKNTVIASIGSNAYVSACSERWCLKSKSMAKNKAIASD